MPPTDHPAAAPAVEPVDLEGIRADAERVLAWYSDHVFAVGLSLSATLLIRKRIPALLALVASRDAEIAGLKAEVGRLKEIEWMYQELCK